MSPVLKTILLGILAIVVGVVAGSFLNMGLVVLGGKLVSLPSGVDPSNAESIASNIHLYGPQHFVFPFLAHALGTLLGAFLAAKIAYRYKMVFALVIGAFFLAGGIYVATLIPAPTWFIALDITVAYIPMAYFGGRLGSK